MIEMKYYVEHPTLGCGSSSCVVHFRAEPAVNPKHNKLAVAYMLGTHVPPGNVSEYRRNINHETGHIFGLLDPSFTNQYYGGCFSAQDIDTFSVMHQYGNYCNASEGYTPPYIVWPTSQDLTTIVNNMLATH